VKKGKDIYFILYLIGVVIMAIIYFSVPEREAFLENQVQWWSEMWEVVTDGREGAGVKAIRE
jgi:hypothetical protein